jgi:hypothetical protein
MAVVDAPVVVLEYGALLGRDSPPELLDAIGRAFGYDGPGLLAVRGVPGFVEARAAALPFAYTFGHLPAAVKAKYEHPVSCYSFGWSHGKERLEGRLDTAKGSYYANPVVDAPTQDPALIAAHPSFATPNIWPAEGDCPGFEAAYKRCAGVMVAAAAQLARHCDAYVASQLPPGAAPAPDLALHAIVTRCRMHKARLLYYFPAGGDAAAAAAPAGK